MFPFKLMLNYIHNNIYIIWTYIQVVSDDGTRVKREQPFTESDLEELQVIWNSSYIEWHYYINSIVFSRYKIYGRMWDKEHLFYVLGPNCRCRKSSRWSLLPESNEALFSSWQVKISLGLCKVHHLRSSHEKLKNHILHF